MLFMVKRTSQIYDCTIKHIKSVVQGLIDMPNNDFSYKIVGFKYFFCKSITRSDVRDQITIGMLLVSPHHPFRQVPLCSYNKYLPPW
jgi:hypothetical protein